MKNAKAQEKSTDIAVVGMSALFPKSNGLKSFWKVLRLGVDTISEVPETHWSPEDYFDEDQKAPDKTYCRRGGFLDPYPFDPTEFSMPPTALQATDTSQLLGLVAAKAALEDAGYGSDRKFDRETTSVILGVTGTLELVVPLGARLGHPYWKKALQESGLSPELVEEVMARIAADYVPWQENSFPGLLGNVVAGRIANKLDLHGTNCVVDAACASTLSAAHLAFLELETGKADMVITGGTDTFNDIFMYMCFSKTPALSASGKIRPFDADSDGTMLGEGIGMVVLKRLADAKKDGDRVYCVIKGVGTASDGKGGAVYAPVSVGQARAIRKAYKNSGIDPRTVEMVEAHGTGTKVGDVVEFEGLKTVFGESSKDKGWCALGSVKSQIGHTKAAAGSAGLIKTALSLYNKVFLPTINVSKPNPKLGIEDSAFYLNTISRPWVSNPQHPRRAGLSSFGFGGSNFHLVLEEDNPKRLETAWDGSVEIAGFSAPTKSELIKKLKQAKSDSRSLALVAYESRASFKASDSHRLLVVSDSGEIAKELETAINKLEKGENPELYGCTPKEGKTAFIFPGQGSQYVNMGRELACVFPELMESLEDTGRDIAQAIFPAPTFDKAVEQGQGDFLTATDRAQPALGVIERGYIGLLERFGLKPEGAAGHSYGELSALYAAGVIDAEGLIRLSRERGRLMASQGDDLGTMMAVKGSLDKVEQVLAESKTKVVLANRNSPEQCVLSGSAEELNALGPILKKAGLRGVPLKVGAAFHSSFVAGAREPFHKLTSKIKFAKASIPVYANKTAELYPSSEAKARELLADQLVHQVNFVGLIQKMYADGFRTFIEVGPKAVLTGLVKAILKEKSDIEVVALDRSAGRKSSLLDLATSLAELAALGHSVNLTAWEGAPPLERKRRMTVPISGANYRSEKPQTPPVRKANSITPFANASGNKDTLEKKTVAMHNPVPASKPSHSASIIESIGSGSPILSTAQAAAVPTPTMEASSTPAVSTPPANIADLLPHIEALQELSRQTAQVHQQFLKSQEAAQLALGKLLGGHTAPATGSSSAYPVAHSPAPAPLASRPTGSPALSVAKSTAPSAPVFQAAATAPTAAAKPALAPKPAAPRQNHLPAIPSIASPLDQVLGIETGSGDIAKELLKVVADKTGYPAEMLTLEMDLEADLGIDSIKRVEILAAVEEALPALPKVDSDRLGSLRTLGEIVGAMTPAGGYVQAAPVGAPTGASTAIKEALLKVVADKTGYPAEMLTLEMDLEADLGIDSIKRVEILAAVEEAMPDLPKVDSDRLGSLRTLGEIVEAMTPAGGYARASAGPAAVVAHAAPAASGTSTAVKEVLLKVVADKTGYPADMLTLEMDLEADLGIDSIKRVEILAAVEEAVPELPKVDSDRLGSLRTLGEIVEAMTPAGGYARASVGPAAVVAPAAPVASGSSVAVREVLLKVVADKTGYPADMLTLEMDLEADLGIDSIKRVEILAAVEEAMPELPKVDSDRLGSLRTLGEIVEAMTPAGSLALAAAGSVPGLASAAGASTAVKGVLLKVVADKTGYPADMLALEMDLEADLGIDSIKRVEILAAVEEALPELPKVDSDRLGSLRTLGEIVAAMTPASSLAPAAVGNGPGLASASVAFATGTETKDGSSQDPRPISRQVLQLVDLSSSQTGYLPLPEGHSVAIFEDSKGLGAELLGAFESRGVSAHLIDKIDAIPANVGMLVIVGNGGEKARSRKFLSEAFKLVRSLATPLRKAEGALFTITSLDGSFGLKGKAFDPIIAGLSGIPKTVAHEWPEVLTRAIDRHPEVTVDTVIDELMKEGPVEVALSPGRRQTLTTIASPVSHGQAKLGPKDVVLVTGGARGVTAACALAVAKAYNSKFILLGRTPLEGAEFETYDGINDEAALKKEIMQRQFKGKATPKELQAAASKVASQREIRSTLKGFKDAGVTCEYLAVDVRDKKRLSKELAAAGKRLGAITALIHGAGVLADRKIEDKTEEMFESVLSTKVDSLLILSEILPSLSTMVFFSSVTARFGRPGQLDYCMANEVLNKFAQLESRRRPGCTVIATGWGPWAGGMVTPSLAREFERMGVGLIPLDSGAKAVVDELAHDGKAEAEVLFGDGFPEPTPSKTRQSKAVKAQEGGGELLLQKALSVSALPFLQSHKLKSQPVLPMAFMLEWFVQGAMLSLAGSRLIGVDDLRVYRGVTISDGVEPTLAVRAVATESDPKSGISQWSLELRDLNRNILHAKSVVILGDSQPQSPQAKAINGLAANAYGYSSEAIYSSLLFHGPDFHAVGEVRGISDHGLVASLKSASKPAQWEKEPLRSDWATEPLVIDGVLQLGILWCWEIMGKPSLPNGFAHYRQFVNRYPKTGVQAALRVVSHGDKSLVADCDLLDAKGIVLGQFTGLEWTADEALKAAFGLSGALAR